MSSESLHEIKLRHKNELKALQTNASSSSKGIGNKKKFKEEEKVLLQRHAEEIKEFQQKKKHTSQDGEGDDSNKHTQPSDASTSSSLSTTQPQAAAPEMTVAEQIVSMSFYNPEKLEAQQQQRHMSKKQLKKQRQLEQEKQRRTAIEQEVSSMKDERQDEINKLQQHVLQPLHLKIYEIRSDGNCMFAACQHQLQYIAANASKDTDNGEYTHQQLRHAAGTYIKTHIDEFQPYLHNENDEPIDVNTYYQQLVDEQNVKWGTHTELVALSAVLRRPIHIYTAEQSQPIVVKHHESNDEKYHDTDDEDVEPLRLSFHKHYFSLGQHYNSLIPQQDT